MYIRSLMEKNKSWNFDCDKYDYIFFDFDGVIKDSEHIKVEGFVKLYEPYGKDVVNKVLEHHKTDGGLDRYRKFKLYHNEFLGRNIDEKETQELAREYSKLVRERVINAKHIEGAPEFLRLCKERKKICFLVSSTPEDEIKNIIDAIGLKGYFKEIKGSPRKKEDNVKDLIEKYGVDAQKAVLFGDSSNDLRAARFNNINFIGINYPAADISYKNFKEILRRTR